MWSNSGGGATWVSALRSLPVPQELSALVDFTVGG
jgi:hypothetical protein